MSDSILTTIKKLLGLEEEYTSFDTDIIIHINSVLMILYQLDVGLDKTKPFSISSKEETWSEFLGTYKYIEAVKTYVYMKVRLMFDPPTSSFVLESYKALCAEFEWRVNNEAEGEPTDG